MRVAYISQAPQISGAERSLQTMLLSMRDVGVSPLLVCPPGDKMIPWCEKHSIPLETSDLYYRDKWHPFRWLSAVRRLRSLLKARRIDVIHSNQMWSYPTPGAAGRDLGIPRICHLRNEMSPKDVRWWFSQGAEGILCISRYIEKQFAATWPADYARPQIRTILNPVLLPVLGSQAEQKEARNAARQHWEVHTDSIIFGFIGQIIPLKGLLELFEALASLPRSAKWTLLVAGRDPNEGAPHEALCRQHVAQRGFQDRVKFLGFLNDVKPFYRAIDVAIVPSLKEPLGRIPLEAASYAKPSIVFAVGGLPETVRDGQTGWLVPAGDVPALSRSLSNSLEAPSEEYGRNARAWVETISDPHQYAEKIASIYKELLPAAGFLRAASEKPGLMRNERTPIVQ